MVRFKADVGRRTCPHYLLKSSKMDNSITRTSPRTAYTSTSTRIRSIQSTLDRPKPPGTNYHASQPCSQTNPCEVRRSNQRNPY